jgi:ABC-2 type transport system permease protein
MALLAVLAAVTFPKRLNPPPNAGTAINSGPSYPARWK